MNSGEENNSSLNIKAELTAQVALLPDKPGVYLMRDQIGKIIYVGKAVNLKNRVRSYFQQRGLSPKTEALVARIVSFETIVTATEMEALFLAENRPSNLLGRFATPEEVASLSVYVASPQASATTGSALRVDGGTVETIA